MELVAQHFVLVQLIQFVKFWYVMSQVLNIHLAYQKVNSQLFLTQFHHGQFLLLGNGIILQLSGKELIILIMELFTMRLAWIIILLQR